MYKFTVWLEGKTARQTAKEIAAWLSAEDKFGATERGRRYPDLADAITKVLPDVSRDKITDHVVDLQRDWPALGPRPELLAYFAEKCRRVDPAISGEKIIAKARKHGAKGNQHAAHDTWNDMHRDMLREKGKVTDNV